MSTPLSGPLFIRLSRCSCRKTTLMWLWTRIARSPVTSTWAGPTGVGSAEMPGNTACWGCALPTSIQHGTEVLMPEGRRSWNMLSCSGGTSWLKSIFASVSPLKRHWNTPLDTMVFERKKKFSDLNNYKPLCSYELDFISHAIVLKEFHAHSVNRRILRA